MSFFFRTESVLSELDRLRQLLTETGGRVRPAQVAPFLQGPARLLTIEPEVAVLVAALQEGFGDPAHLLKVWDRGAGIWSQRFEDRFPTGRRHTLEDIARALTATQQMITAPLRQVVLPTAIPGYDSSDVPILLGGLFLFEQGGCGQVDWDSTLSTQNSPFPIAVPYAWGENGGLDSVIVPEEWPSPEYVHALYRHRNLLPSGRSPEGEMEVRFNQRTRRITTHHAFPHRDGSSVILETTTDYGVNERSQRGVRLRGYPRSQFAAIEDWQIRDLYSPDPDGSRLDPEGTQFFFFPGAVWEVVTGFPVSVEKFPYGRIARFVRGAVRYLQGEEPDWPRDVRVGVRRETSDRVSLHVSDSKEGTTSQEVAIRFGETVSPGLPVRWQLGMTSASGQKTTVSAIAVDDQNLLTVDRYLKGRWGGMLSYGRALRLASQRRR